MDLVNGKIKPLYFKYLGTTFGSALITSIYSVVDVAMVGQYQGPDDTAALSVVMPIWTIIYSLGLLMGIGGSVIFSSIRGKDGGDIKKSNEYFTASVIGSVILAVIVWIVISFFDRPLLLLFGANEHLLPMAQEYVFPIKFAIPTFLFNQMLAAYLRNDKNPGLATIGVLAGGIFNIFGDYVFIFPCNMGIFGAGLATAIGSTLSFVILLTHFFTKKNTLRLVKPTQLFRKLREITVTGFPSFFIDVAMGVLTVLFNRQILRLLGSSALSVFGVVININSFVQSCSYSVGQSAQPIISTNLGANRGDRIKKTLKYALWTVAVFSAFWVILSMAVPNLYIRIFMSPTPEVLAIAPAIIRCYAISFLLLPLNIFSTYYFQALMKPQIAFAISVSRGLVISGILIFLLPVIAGADAIWFAMPITEVLVCIFVILMMIRYTKRLPIEGKTIQQPQPETQ